ncbi:MAG: ATP synthase F1 subunit epsilon [Pelagibacteraceae bacterium]|jgi:ATP synthase F1 epsilon subunit|nr:ATP synthase F1 subunit epsilon [Pelagibacteraceae bacterium]MDP6784418.1 ATP synthase F1 subunit epsilon [Alphaproteobacteria bacterium]|tara:strand:+ start:21060 stop:21461 length:402 start_codon:yes stop_codon:yes gene_type:complete
MEDTYKIEIVSPEKVIFSDKNVQEVILPSYEGEMGILKDHISIVSFLRPGIVKILKSSEDVSSFFLQDGIIEFYNNNLTILSSKIINIKNLNKEKIEQLITETEKILKDEKLNDDNRYLANHKINTLRSLNLN